MLAVLLALASAAGYGGSDYFGGLTARRASLIRITIMGEAASVALLALVLPLTGLHAPPLASLAWGAAGGIGGAVGALALYLGFRHAAFSVAGPLSAVAAAGFSVLTGLLLGERPGGLALTGIALAMPAIVAVAASPGGAGHLPAATRWQAQGALWGLVAGACFAVLFIALNRAGSGSGLWPVAAAQVAALVVVSGLGAATGDLHLPPASARRLAVLAGVSGGAGAILYFLATHVGLLTVTAVLTSLYPGVTIVLARLLLGERLTVIRLVGLLLAGASVSLIAAGSVANGAAASRTEHNQRAVAPQVLHRCPRPGRIGRTNAGRSGRPGGVMSSPRYRAAGAGIRPGGLRVWNDHGAAGPLPGRARIGREDAAPTAFAAAFRLPALSAVRPSTGTGEPPSR